MTAFTDYYLPEVEKFLERMCIEHEKEIAKKMYIYGFHPKETSKFLRSKEEVIIIEKIDWTEVSYGFDEEFSGSCGCSIKLLPSPPEIDKKYILISGGFYPDSIIEYR